ncbi:filamentous hemagglutinin, partial [Pseudomonas cuatrocienegasensis]
KSLGVGVSLCIPPFCAGASSISGNVGKTDIDSEYASVTEQSGIKAGDDGFQINVGGNTDLVGGVIASSDKAVEEGNNRLVTASLTSRDIKNKAEYDASTVSLGGGYNEVGKDQQGQVQSGGGQTPGTDLAKNENKIGATMPIAISASDSASSVTRSGISGGALVISDEAEQQKRTGQSAEQTVASLNRDVSSDRDGSNALKPIFDEDEIRAGFEIVSAFSNEASTFLANKAREADSKREQAKALQEKADTTNGLSDAERMQLQFGAKQLAAEANAISENWGAGGTYRQITTALIGAAGGNISAGNAAFVQGLVVNYVQQRGAGLIGDLVADGELTEGSPLHAALHGIVACAGAAASSQSCGSGAAGAATSSLLTGLFSESSPDESEEQREAKRNLIVSLVTGLAASSASIDPTTATTAAGAAVDNNWLATQQIVQMKKEYEEAQGLAAKLQVAGKWAYISGKQDVLTQVGIGKGLAESGWNDIEGLAQFAMNPLDGLKGLGELINNPEARAQFGDSVINELNGKIATIKTALEHGGDENAEALGKAIGEIAWQVGGIVTGVGGLAKGGVALAKVGIKVGAQQLDKMAEVARIEQLAAKNAKNPNPMSPMTDSETTIIPDRKVLEGKPNPPDKVSQGVEGSSGAEATGEVATTVPHTPLAGPTGNWKNYTHAEAVIQTQASGRLVNAEKAVIDPNKVTSYALNTTHPVGGNKAKVFESALGYNQTNAASLIAKVQEGAKLYPAKLGASDKFGQRITIDMPITGPNGNTATVRTGWIYDPGSATPRMTTLYVK